MDTQDQSTQPSTAEILAEVERRRAEAQLPKSTGQRRIVVFLDRCVFWLSKHWLALINVLVFLYVGLPFLAPVLMHLDAPGPAAALHVIYKPLCHQLPERSWFLFGSRFAYSSEELAAHADMEQSIPQDWLEELTAKNGQPTFPMNIALTLHAIVGLGNETLGYKVVFCQRDTAIYGAILIAGLLFGVLRRKVRPLPWWAYVFFGVLPMLIDGGFQWLTFNLFPFIYWQVPSLANILFIPPHETIPLLRVITGALFGLATAWLAFPHVQDAMDDFQDTLRKRFGWE